MATHAELLVGADRIDRVQAKLLDMPQVASARRDKHLVSAPSARAGPESGTGTQRLRC